MDPSAIVKKLTDTLLKDPGVKGFVLVGSQAREEVYKATAYSDLEAYIIVDDEYADRFMALLPEIAGALGKVLFTYNNRWAGFSALYDNLFRIELPIIKRSGLKSAFSRPAAQTVKIIFDKTQGELEEALNNRPQSIDFEQLFKEAVWDCWYMQVVGLQYLKKGEIWNAGNVLQILQGQLIKLFELYNDPKILLLEANKRIEEFLTAGQLEVLKQVSSGYDRKRIETSFKNIFDATADIAIKIADKYKFKFDRELMEKLKTKTARLL